MSEIPKREPIKLYSICELIEEGKRRDEEEKELMKLDPRDPRHPTGTFWDKQFNTIDVFWGGYEYSIGLDRITNPRQVCEWLVHLGSKGESWNGMTRARVVDFIEVIFSAKGWDVWRDGPASRETTSDVERKKLTPQLRWDVLKRDGFRCRACGAGPEQGAVLQIDHIVAIVNGGRTTKPNLQTLCACCNFGKGVE